MQNDLLLYTLLIQVGSHVENSALSSKYQCQVHNIFNY